ncbi:hypothetical protein [Mangrovihabitans endophyticus]|uniref:Uncharacterized protein n=1 Tax=Mangrovihabitans endophyticus TaxID=1751298 RepID=A0A8J3C2Z7_9ACTN|nr:hypothetical protein [Mangrovihabitans endophyticus]GGL07715.1 hypothetical protein GCM10012284_47670 [Mangrovihabitans endophyticus]
MTDDWQTSSTKDLRARFLGRAATVGGDQARAGGRCRADQTDGDQAGAAETGAAETGADQVAADQVGAAATVGGESGGGESGDGAAASEGAGAASPAEHDDDHRPRNRRDFSAVFGYTDVRDTRIGWWNDGPEADEHPAGGNMVGRFRRLLRHSRRDQR